MSPIQYIDKINSFMICTTDITQEVERESLLIHSNKLSTLGQMASSIAHEINQPLTSIRLGVDIIKSLLPNDKKILKIMNDMEIQVLRADSIIKHMREFSRKYSNKDIKFIPNNKNFGEVDINEAINDSISLFGEQFSSDGINLELSLEEKIPYIKGDKLKLEQVFVNIINNSKYALLKNIINLDKKISIKSFTSGSNLCVEIRDNGGGIHEEVIDKIFDPFFTTKEVGEGTGLGLAISKNIICSHGGKIDIISNKNKKTIIKIIFELSEIK